MVADRHTQRGATSVRGAMDRMIEESFGGAQAGRKGAFPVDVVDTGDHLMVRAILPGARPDDVRVTVQGDTLSISGHASDEWSAATGQWLVRETRWGELTRQVPLTVPVDVNHAVANFDNGVLTLTLPKVKRAGPRQIKVGGSPAQASGATGYNPSLADPTKPGAAGANSASRGQANPDDAPRHDPVTIESEESFPASDPPSWTPERA